MSNNLHHYLIVGSSWIGDMMMAQPLFQLLKQNNPRATLDVLAPPWNKDLLQRMKEVDNVLSLPFTHGQWRAFDRIRYGRQLRGCHYTHAIVLPNSFKSALIPFAADIPVRTGWRGEFRYGLLNDLRILNKIQYPSTVQRFLALGYEPGVPLRPELPTLTLHVNAEKVQVTLREHGLAIDKPILALAPGAEFGPAKCWPAEYFAQVAVQKAREGYQVWLLGSPNDQAIAAQVSAQAAGICTNKVGQTSLSQVIDLLSVATAVITNDSGLMHIACALNKPTIVVYGSTAVELAPPLSARARVLAVDLPCRPCRQRVCPLQHFRCMREILPAQVVTTLNEMLDE